MSITVSCPSCGSSLHVKSKFAGKSGECPKCRAKIRIPMDSAEAVESKPVQPIPKPVKKSDVPPATDRQKEYARTLGIDFPDDIDRREISKLIDAAQDQRLDDLAKVEEREGNVYEKLRKEIAAEMYRDDTPVSKATPNDMVNALEAQGFAAIILTLNPRDVGNENATASIVFGDGNMTEEDMRETLMRLGNAVLNQELNKMARRMEELSDRL
jgi:DNA-directed RNA polymerase subunit M/transcription elongation factor TFIIS